MKKLKMGMVGGGIGAFIGEVHRKAALMDGGVEVVAGAFDVDPDKSLEQGRNLGLDPKRVYRTYQDMIEGELALPEHERVDFVSICARFLPQRRGGWISFRSARLTTRILRLQRRVLRQAST